MSDSESKITYFDLFEGVRGPSYTSALGPISGYTGALELFWVHGVDEIVVERLDAVTILCFSRLMVPQPWKGKHGTS